MPISTRWLAALIGFAVIVRMLLMVMLPLTDTTEARYADIARMMLETNDWITPWFAPGEPFWGKPPLSFWFQALSFKLFGVNEFAGRLPSLLMHLLTAGLVYFASLVFQGDKSPQNARHRGLLAVLIYSTMSLPFISAGAVMTDAFLVFATTLTLASWLAVINGRSQPWQWLFFVGLGIGLLAKGPLVFVLCGLPIAGWMLVSRQWTIFWRTLPWSRGLLITALIALPWYIVAEIKTPGFLEYFVIGEHISRFLISDWPGDRYGDAHEFAHGTIWLYLLFASFPWVIVLFDRIFRGIGSLGEDRLVFSGTANGSLGLVVCSAFAPALFFTLSGNILWTYVLPGLPFLAVIMAVYLSAWLSATRAHLVIVSSLIVPALTLVAGLVIFYDASLISTEKPIVDQIAADTFAVTTLHYIDNVPFSARFYSHGRAQTLPAESLDAYLQTCPDAVLAIRKKSTDLLMKIDGRFPEVTGSSAYRAFRINGC